MTFFGWSGALRKILTIDSFQKRYVIMVDWCCMYKMSGEFVDYLLVYFEVACAIWIFFSSVDLGCLGLCLDEYLICMLVSGLLAVLEVLLFRRWCLCTFYGVYEEK